MIKRIFIVEDDMDISELLEFNLKRQGYTVETCNNGSEAYQNIIKELPDLVILDLSLPGLSGMEICRYMRNNRHTRKIPVIILTARTAETDRLASLKSGADKFITKPFSIKEILTNIQDLASRKQTLV